MRRMYSENQLIKILENKDIIAKTLKQKEANWKIDNPLSTLVVVTGLEYNKVYAFVGEINGIFYIIWNFTIKNTTENAINFDCNASLQLEEEIAEKIIDFSGKSVKESNIDNISSTFVYYGSASELYMTKIFTLRNSNTANGMQIINVNATSIPANTTMKFSFRTLLTLIDNE